MISGVVQAYSSPFLTVAFCAAAYARDRTWPDVLLLLPALLALHVGTLVMSGVHSGVLTGGPATWVWVGGFLVGAVAVAAALAATLAGRRRTG